MSSLEIEVPDRIKYGSTDKQLRIRLDKHSQQRIASVTDYLGANIGTRPSASLTVRLALRVLADLCGGDPISGKRSGLLAVLKDAAAGR